MIVIEISLLVYIVLGSLSLPLGRYVKNHWADRWSIDVLYSVGYMIGVHVIMIPIVLHNNGVIKVV